MGHRPLRACRLAGDEKLQSTQERQSGLKRDSQQWQALEEEKVAVRADTEAKLQQLDEETRRQAKLGWDEFHEWYKKERQDAAVAAAQAATKAEEQARRDAARVAGLRLDALEITTQGIGDDNLRRRRTHLFRGLREIDRVQRAMAEPGTSNEEVAALGQYLDNYRRTWSEGLVILTQEQNEKIEKENERLEEESARKREKIEKDLAKAKKDAMDDVFDHFLKGMLRALEQEAQQQLAASIVNRIWGTKGGGPKGTGAAQKQGMVPPKVKTILSPN